MKMQNRKMYRFASTALALAALTACGPVNRSFDTVKTPVVSQSQLSHDLPVHSGGLGTAGAQALDNWFSTIRLGYSDRVTIDDPDSFGSDQRRAAVAEVLGRYGLLLDQTAPITPGAVPAGSIRVIVTRSEARVDNCPDWDRKSHPEPAASTMSNFGCATQSNLAAMIADPNDLVAGNSYAGSDANTAVKAVDALRKAEPTGKLWKTTIEIEMKGSK